MELLKEINHESIVNVLNKLICNSHCERREPKPWAYQRRGSNLKQGLLRAIALAM